MPASALRATRRQLTDVTRVVVKAGTNVLVAPDGTPSLGRLHALAESIAAWQRRGVQVTLVSSGAVGIGMRRVGLVEKPTDLRDVQACAAVGQGELMAIYQAAFHLLGSSCAQVLLTQEDFGVTERRRNLTDVLARLLERGIVPIVNENDTVATHELEQMMHFGDNDKLAALVAADIQADALVILSDVDGLYTANPHDDPTATRIAEITELTAEILGLADGKSARGRGGMLSKLEAAKLGMDAGVAVVIADGSSFGAVDAVLAGADVGTLFVPSTWQERA